MRQPMLRWRMFRHGGHHVNSASLSGCSARPTSTKCAPSRRSKSSRSSGRWPMTPALRSRGCTSMSACATLRSPHSDHVASFRVQLRRPVGEPRQEPSFAAIVLAAVGDVHRREDEIAERDLHDPRFHVEVGMREHRIGVVQRLADVQRNAGIAAHAVPVDVVIGVAAALGNLRRARPSAPAGRRCRAGRARANRRAALRARGCR